MTAQIGDVLLDKCFRNNKHVTLDGGPLLAAWPEDERPEFSVWSPDCVRGYKATWIINSRGWLYLTSVLACVKSGLAALRSPQQELWPDGPVESLHTLFPNNNGPVRADWVTGEIATALSFIPVGVRMPRTGPIDVAFRVKAGRVVEYIDYGHELRY